MELKTITVPKMNGKGYMKVASHEMKLRRYEINK